MPWKPVTAVLAAQLVVFFMTEFMRLPWMVRLVSRTVVTRAVIEQQVLQAFDGLVELLHGGEVAVDDDVERSPQQEPDALGGQVGSAFPAGNFDTGTASL